MRWIFTVDTDKPHAQPEQRGGALATHARPMGLAPQQS